MEDDDDDSSTTPSCLDHVTILSFTNVFLHDYRLQKLDNCSLLIFSLVVLNESCARSRFMRVTIAGKPGGKSEMEFSKLAEMNLLKNNTWNFHSSDLLNWVFHFTVYNAW